MSAAKRKQRITYVIPSLNIGGMERQLIQQLAWLCKHTEHTYTIITLRTAPSSRNFINAVPAGVDVVSCNIQRRFDVLGVWRLYKLLHRSQSSIVVASTFPANTLVRLGKLWLSYKVIVREHNLYPDKTWLHNWIDYYLHTYLTNVHIAVSEEAARAAEKQAGLNPGSIRVIENGIAINEWEIRKNKLPQQEVLKQRLGFRTEDIVILSVARLKAKKNIDSLIRAFAKLAANNPLLQLALVGAGEELEPLQRLAHSLDCKHQIHFFGRQTEVEKFYAIADLFVLPSTQEGFPNVLLEALFFSLPIVVTPVPAARRVVASDVLGEVVDATPTALADGIRAVMGRTEKEQIQQKKAARSHIQQFSIETIAMRYRDLFASME